MATITAQAIVSRVQTTLLDETNVRWDEAELLDALNDGQREIVSLKPDAYSRNVIEQMVAGTKQSIAADGVILLDVVRNMGAAGSTPGRAVTRISRDDIDQPRPDWHNEVAAVPSLHYIFDERDPKTFYVTPPQPVTPEYIEYIYSAAPTDVPDLATAITLDDIYQTALFYYIMFRAHSKETQEASPQKASSYYSLFRQVVTGKASAEASSGVSQA